MSQLWNKFKWIFCKKTWKRAEKERKKKVSETYCRIVLVLDYFFDISFCYFSMLCIVPGGLPLQNASVTRFFRRPISRTPI